MTTQTFPKRRALTPRWRLGVCAALAGLAAGCGGGNPLGNPPDVTNGEGRGGQSLSFAYYQRCINPVFLAQLPIPGSAATNTCAGSGCHDNANGTGGAFRIVPTATAVPLPASSDAITATDMYKNFYSAQGEVAFTAVLQSRLLTKPRVQGVLHGGGLIFETDLDPNVRLLLYWMTHPAPAGQDEFSYDPAPGACPTQ